MANTSERLRDIGRGPIGISRTLATTPGCLGVCDNFLGSLSEESDGFDFGGLTRVEKISVGEAMARIMVQDYLPQGLPYPAPGDSGAGPRAAPGMKNSQYRSCSPTVFSAWRDAVLGYANSFDKKNDVLRGRTGRLKIKDFYDISQSKLIAKNPHTKHKRTKGLVDALMLIGEGKEVEIKDVIRGDIFITKTKSGGHVRIVTKVEATSITFVHAGFGDKKAGAKEICVTTKKGKKSCYKEGQKGKDGNPAVQVDKLTHKEIQKKQKNGERVYFGRASGVVVWNINWNVSQGLLSLQTDLKGRKTIFYMSDET